MTKKASFPVFVYINVNHYYSKGLNYMFGLLYILNNAIVVLVLC